MNYFDLTWMLPLGFCIGVIGTLIGAGGGFILVPLLLIIYPNKSPETITSVSLAVVFFNALSGSSAYARMKRIDYKSGMIFAAAVIPGAVIGALNVSFMSRFTFNLVFGILLIALAIYLLFSPDIKNKKNEKKSLGHFLINITDANGINYIFSYNLTLGIIISVFVGYLSSLLGIGGGILHVPALVHLFNFPIHIATATSHFILSIMTFSGSMVHLLEGSLSHELLEVASISVGVIIGAPLGAKLSNRIKGKIIIRTLAVALGIVGLRILFMSL